MINIRQEINVMLDELPEPFLWAVFHFLKAILSLMPNMVNNGNDAMSKPTQHGRLALLKQAGSFADDDTLDNLLADAYIQRGRPEVDMEVETHVYS
ncbi:MAG: hypothetical protein B6242_17095 [Anaerolineaceae bacterium 4572_78]|nr:MAG: hypothetical protein B6242_17095 [Anaerolineaceae bacterium 4572_78]